MKTLVKHGISIYVFADSEAVNITSQNIVIGNPETLIISDCTSSDTTLHTNVTPPTDWVGHKYLFNGTAWSANSAYVDPKAGRVDPLTGKVEPT